MPWIERNEAGEITGLCGCEQFEGQEFIPDYPVSPEVQAFMAKTSAPAEWEAAKVRLGNLLVEKQALELLGRPTTDIDAQIEAWRVESLASGQE